MEQEVSQQHRRPRPRRITAFGIVLALLFATTAFFSGLHIGTQTTGGIETIFASSEPSESVDFSTFWEVWRLLDERFVATATSSSVSAEERVRGAIKGLVDSYDDPYTAYLPPQQSEKFEADISGNFEGVGMEIGQRDGVLTVIAPLPGTPAERAGIQAGDAIVRIDDTSTESMSIDEAVTRIRGEQGTEVMLTIVREGEDELLKIAVVRDRIDIPTIETEDRGDVFVISLFNFSAISEARFEQALRSYVASGNSKLVLDVRGNPGGFLQSAVSIASYFLPTGKVIVREHFGAGESGEPERLYRSQGKTLRGFAPEEMVVLVDGGSASASEILAGALREHGVATLVGSQTFGKGSVQELVSLNDGSSVKITIARWLTPDGTSISEGGLTPDIEVERTAEDRTAGRDPQMQAALDFLNR